MKKKAIICGIVIALMLSIAVTAYAVSGYTMTYLPGTTDTVTNLPDPDSVTNGETYTVSSQIPQREGYEFLGWVLDYEVAANYYIVTYVVNPDPTYGTPEGSTVPTDPTLYVSGETVDVADQLTTTVGYAYTEKGERVPGTWTFVTWDKDDFPITEDTTITGGWTFTPAKPTTYHYTVHYYLYDTVTKVHADKKVEIDELGKPVTEYALSISELNKKYNNPKKYRVREGYDSVTMTITEDNSEIIIYYEPRPNV